MLRGSCMRLGPPRPAKVGLFRPPGLGALYRDLHFQIIPPTLGIDVNHILIIDLRPGLLTIPSTTQFVQLHSPGLSSAVMLRRCGAPGPWQPSSGRAVAEHAHSSPSDR